MAKAAYPTIGIAALVMFGIVYFIGCLQMIPVGLKSIDLKSTGIILFDRRPNRIWRDKIWHRTETYNGQKIEIWGM